MTGIEYIFYIFGVNCLKFYVLTFHVSYLKVIKLSIRSLKILLDKK